MAVGFLLGEMTTVEDSSLDPTVLFFSMSEHKDPLTPQLHLGYCEAVWFL